MIKESFGEEKVIVLSNNDNFQCILKRTKEKTITKEYFEKIQKNISEKTGYTATIGVSRVENSYQRFGKAYQDARDAVEIAVCQEFNSKVLCIEDHHRKPRRLLERAGVVRLHRASDRGQAGSGYPGRRD